MKRIFAILFCISLFIAFSAAAQEKSVGITDQWLLDHYTKREVMIPMRDGVNLSTSIYEPVKSAFSGSGVDFSSGRPIIMTRTPYGIKPYGEKFAGELKSYMRNFVRNGYVIVFQSVRGTYMSEGSYENVRPFNPGKSVGHDGRVGTDEASDSYDTVDWLIHNVASNGKVGVKGVSYPGFYATLAGMSGHPSIKAISPQAPVTDWFMGDDIHHNGAIFLSDLCSFGGSFFRTRGGLTEKGMPGLVVPDKPIYDYYKGKPISEVLSPMDTLAFMKDVISHPDYDSFWIRRNPTHFFRNMRCAVMVVGGLYDAEDCYGAIETFRILDKRFPKSDSYLVEGPWYHGGWRDLKYDHLDGSYFGTGSAAYFIDEIEYPFFAYYLEGKGNKPARINMLPSGETGKDLMDDRSSDNMWVRSSSWPLNNVTFRKLYLHGDRTVSFSHGGYPETISYISDPASPVPFFHGNPDSRGRDYMAGDQSFASERSDVISFTGRTLADTLAVAGPLKVHISFSSTGTDADIVVKLIDVRPDGYQMMVRGDVMPARYRDGFEKAEALKPGKRYSVTFTLNDVYHYFLPGHRLMVQVQSSWFPLVAMNPQTFVENQCKALANDYASACITLYFEKNANSYIEIPVL